MMEPSIFRLSNEIYLEIFLHLEHPESFSQTCRRFRNISTDVHFISRWFLARHGIHHAFFFLAILHPRLMTASVIYSLREHGALLSRYFVQFLAQYHGRPTKQLQDWESAYWDPEDDQTSMSRVSTVFTKMEKSFRDIPLDGYVAVMQIGLELYNRLWDSNIADDYALWRMHTNTMDHDFDFYSATDQAKVPPLKDLVENYHFYPVPWDRSVGHAFANIITSMPENLKICRPFLKSEDWITEQTLIRLFEMARANETTNPINHHQKQFDISDAIIHLGFTAFDEAFIRSFISRVSSNAVSGLLQSYRKLPLTFDLEKLAHELICHDRYDDTSLDPWNDFWTKQRAIYEHFPCRDLLYKHLQKKGLILRDDEEDPPPAPTLPSRSIRSLSSNSTATMTPLTIPPMRRWISAGGIQFVTRAVGYHDELTKRCQDIYLLRATGHPAVQPHLQLGGTSIPFPGAIATNGDNINNNDDDDGLNDLLEVGPERARATFAKYARRENWRLFQTEHQQNRFHMHPKHIRYFRYCDNRPSIIFFFSLVDAEMTKANQREEMRSRRQNERTKRQQLGCESAYRMEIRDRTIRPVSPLRSIRVNSDPEADKKLNIDATVDDWFQALDEAWVDEEAARVAEGRRGRSFFQLELEKFLGVRIK